MRLRGANSPLGKSLQSSRQTLPFALVMTLKYPPPKLPCRMISSGETLGVKAGKSAKRYTLVTGSRVGSGWAATGQLDRQRCRYLQSVKSRWPSPGENDCPMFDLPPLLAALVPLPLALLPPVARAAGAAFFFATTTVSLDLTTIALRFLTGLASGSGAARLALPFSTAGLMSSPLVSLLSGGDRRAIGAAALLGAEEDIARAVTRRRGIMNEINFRVSSGGQIDRATQG